MYLAHISEDKSREESILAHLTETAIRARAFAEAFQCGEWGYGCGLMHDIGKYSEKFQKRLRGGSITDHATAGARELYNRHNYIAAYCISGHHSGLLDGGGAADSGGDATLQGRMKKELENYQAYREEIQIPEFPRPPIKILGNGGFSISFFIRMLFSCLVDADYLKTELFMRDGKIERDSFDTMEELWGRLCSHVAPWLENKNMDTVNGRRTAILQNCLDKGKSPMGLFRLTVPTGGGKTISSLAFALQHAKEHHLSHIIYVIPYTSIIEQNAQVFKEILGEENVLEDHCNVVYDDSEELNVMQLAAENWACPVVVTTNVQFFESLFASKTSKCRKLHQLANSVIIFDEAQMLPVNYLKPCIQAISELVYNYHSTAVLCTATQPPLHDFFPKQIKITELCSNVEEQYEFFRRTQIKNIGTLSSENLVSSLKEHVQILCILNTRKNVQTIYEALSESEGTFHLSTLMYPKHRKKVLENIKNRLKTGQPCRLIATSLVEAGVDFDFPTVYRELAGIDSVIQAAGRCNREGKFSAEQCETVVFRFDRKEETSVPQSLKLPIAVAEQIEESYKDLGSLEAIQGYFKRLYHFKGNGLDAKDIVQQFEESVRSGLYPFATIAKKFKLIESDAKTILIDKESEAEIIVERIKRGEASRQLVRQAGQYCINLYQDDFEKLNGAGRLEAIGLEFYVLRNREQYTDEKGLKIQVERGDAVFF